MSELTTALLYCLGCVAVGLLVVPWVCWAASSYWDWCNDIIRRWRD